MARGRTFRRGAAVVAALTISALGFAAYASAKGSSGAQILAQPEQRQREATALKIYRSAQLQGELTKAKALFAASQLAASPSGRSTIDRASEAMAYQAALYAANYDTVHPYILWGTNAAHRWMGLDVPSSGYGLDSPDNIYRHATLDGSAHYVIHGTVHEVGPSQQTFVIYRTIPGVSQTMNDAGHMDEIAGLKSESLVKDAQGNFTITIDADPANGRANHLQVPADLDGLHLMIRDSLADWSRELPVELAIERLDPPAGATGMGEAQMVDKATQILAAYVPFWINWFESYVHAKPLNEIVHPWKRVQGWGMTQQGRFAFADDEAWVITLDTLDARFFDIQISDPWTKAVEYVNRTGSFNGSQPVANGDGTVTFVASPRDPGVYNWLDTSGLTAGTFQVRWQALPAEATGEGAVRDVRVVKFKDLRDSLPDGTRFVTARDRARQLRQRAASYANRLR